MSVPAADPSDTARLAELIQTFQADVWRYVRYLGAEAAEADDLVQETFLAVFRSNFVHTSDSQTAGYLRTTARRQLLMLRRQQRREIATLGLEAAEDVWAETFAGGPTSPYLDALRLCVEGLEGKAKTAVRLRYQEQSSREAAATELGMKPEGVKTLLRRTRAALRKCVEQKLEVTPESFEQTTAKSAKEGLEH